MHVHSFLSMEDLLWSPWCFSQIFLLSLFVFSARQSEIILSVCCLPKGQRHLLVILTFPLEYPNHGSGSERGLLTWPHWFFLIISVDRFNGELGNALQVGLRGLRCKSKAWSDIRLLLECFLQMDFDLDEHWQKDEWEYSGLPFLFFEDKHFFYLSIWSPLRKYFWYFF